MNEIKSYTCLVLVEYQGQGNAYTNRLSRVVTIPDFPFNHDTSNEDDDDNWEAELFSQFSIQLKAQEIENFLKCHSHKPQPVEILKKLRETNFIPNLYRVRFQATRVDVTVIEHAQNPITHNFKSEVLIEEHHSFKH